MTLPSQAGGFFGCFQPRFVTKVGIHLNPLRVSLQIRWRIRLAQKDRLSLSSAVRQEPSEDNLCHRDTTHERLGLDTSSQQSKLGVINLMLPISSRSQQES